MEALKVRIFAVALMAVIMATSMIERTAAADAPAPSPTSDATSLFAPTLFASLTALIFGLFYC
ncbi:arabinogalactan protein 14-like [Magnolia sinica]|uniref:arabinogalactan protein 14-like n=1 Tax=Magnolia sinica TaxID=86752 RepID=UPI00265855F4|nr:arabinogalactan protein 14-like [Magnolia sinica]